MSQKIWLSLCLLVVLGSQGILGKCTAAIFSVQWIFCLLFLLRVFRNGSSSLWYSRKRKFDQLVQLLYDNRFNTFSSSPQMMYFMKDMSKMLKSRGNFLMKISSLIFTS